MVSRSSTRQSLKPLSIFVPHGATKLTDHDYHGDGLIQWALIEELARRGHHLTVVTPKASLVGTIPSNVEIHELPGFERFGLIPYLFRAYAMYRSLSNKRRFDIIHQMNPVVRGATIPWFFSRVPIVLGTYVGDWPYEVPSYRMRTAPLLEWARMLMKVALDAIQQAFADVLIVATPFARNRIPFPALVRDRVREIPHGVDVQQYSGRPEQGDPAIRDNSVLCIGQVAAHKGLTVVLDAFDFVVKRMPTANLILLGSGSMVRAAIDRAEQNGWRSQLQIIGPVSNDRVPGWVRAATVVVSAALGEPYGQTVVEALAIGRPVIINDSGGVKYLIAGTENPVVPMGDAKALSAVILDLLRDPRRAQAIGQRNREVAVHRFAWTRVVDELEKAYAAVLDLHR